MREIYFIIREREFKNYIHTNIFRWKYITAIHRNLQWLLHVKVHQKIKQ